MQCLCQGIDSACGNIPQLLYRYAVEKDIPDGVGVSNIQKVDLETFKKIVSESESGHVIVTFMGFWHTDSCGGVYYVEYWGMTYWEAKEILNDFDPLFCAFPAGYD